MVTKTYNDIEFFEFRGALICNVHFASKDDAETALERALCEYVKDEPMTRDFWAVSARLENEEWVELVLMSNDCGETPWSCTHIKYSLDSECYRKDERTDNYEYYRMIGDIKNLINEYESESDEDIKADFSPIWAERFASAVRMYPNEFTAEEIEQGERISKAILDNGYEY